MPSILQRADYEDFLVRVYFGPNENLLQACWRRAYRDFNRTLRGIGTNQSAYSEAERVMNRLFAAVQNMASPSQMDFDDWHRRACGELASVYGRCGYKSFSVGQAQKWLNMTFKYIFVLGERRLRGFGHLYDLCHVPIDRILIDALVDRGFPPLPCAWSRLDCYDTYLDRQEWVRAHFDPVPLDVEFLLWMGRRPPAR